jgi:hypothetical protein
MRLDLLPEWLRVRPDVQELCEAHGCAFLACVGFKDNAHLEHYLATGDIRLPASIRTAKRLATDPVRRQRKTLADRAYRARRRGDTDALRIAQTELELFDLIPRK